MTGTPGTGTTICALATPPGEGAVGMIRVSGPEALALALQLCDRDRLVPRVMHAVTLRRAGEVLDRGLVCYMPGPRSYTGEDVVELFGHGGALNMERLHTAILALGARTARPGEFTRRAFLNGRLDLTQAEAVAQVIAARGARALRNAHALLSGELGARVARVRAALIEQAAGLEAQVDFADDVEADDSGAGARELAAGLIRSEAALRTLCETYRQGRALDGAVVALVGPANAGKSSLFNRLLERERALVSPEPGTTRDYLEGEVSWGGLRVVLVDTAGAGAAEELSSLERAGQALVGPVLQRCELRLHLREASGDLDWPDDAEVRVASKVDLLSALQRRELPEDAIATSAVEGTGLDELRQRILHRLSPVPSEGVMVTHRRQWEQLSRAQQACGEAREAHGAGLGPELVVEHLREALSALGEVTGERFTEEVLDAVFSDFCIGK